MCHFKKQENFSLAQSIQRVSQHIKMYWFLCFILLMGVGDSTTQENPQSTANETATLLLACKVCCPKRQVLDSTQSTPRRLSVDGESVPMINESSKPEEDKNHSGPEEQKKPEEPEKPIEEAAEATEVSDQASMEDSTLCVMPAEESLPNPECEMSEKITFDDAEQP
ncbi:hypothetical protein MHYP_G00184860 [Metynnis hypsauchen]